ncbi:hypothetical protein SB861_47340 [Paraburkholderia sp. SIMBA_049]
MSLIQTSRVREMASASCDGRYLFPQPSLGVRRQLQLLALPEYNVDIRQASVSGCDRVGTWRFNSTWDIPLS